MKGKIVDRCYIKHEKEAGKLRMSGGAWSINMDWLKPEDVDSICYVTETTEYTIPTTIAIAHGFERVFAGERKLVVPLKYWNQNSWKKNT